MTIPSPEQSRPPIRDRIKELRRVPAGQLAANPRNWRRHPASQRRALRALLREVGYADALLAREEKGQLVLIDGHLRKSLDPKQTVPVLVLDVTEAEADKLLLTLDPLAGLAQPDPAQVSELLRRVETSSAAVRELLEGIARGAKVPGLRAVDHDVIPPVPVDPVTRRGDLWLLGEHRVLCGDSTSAADMARVMDGDRADAVWTDPPYGVEYVGKTPAALRLVSDTESGLTALLAGAFSVADGVLKPGAAVYIAHPAGRASVAFAAAVFERGWLFRQTLVWVKDTMVLGHADYHYRHEPIIYARKPGQGRWGRGHQGWHGGNSETSVFEIPRPSTSREHPTTKPVELIRRCLANSTHSGETVLDPFLGSGSTVAACHELGVRMRGIDIDPGYVDVAVARWEAFTGARAERIPMTQMDGATTPQ